MKPVPAGGTAVGNSARIVMPAVSKVRETKRSDGFCVYGITPNADDPVSLAIHGLIDLASTQTQRVDDIVAALERLSARVEALNGIDGAALVDLKRLCTSMGGKCEEQAAFAERGAEMR